MKTTKTNGRVPPRPAETACIRYTVIPSPLGRLLLAASERGLCAVRIGDDDAALIAGLPAEVRRDDAGLRPWADDMLRHLNGDLPHLDVPLDVRGTAFQHCVWKELLAIPYGATRSYSEVARRLGRPTAARAVARACATNPVALFIPCHRVVREGGGLGGYYWGLERKKALLAAEKSAAAVLTAPGGRPADDSAA